MAESTLERYRKLINQLKEERARGWEPHWRDIIDFMMPRRGRLKGDLLSQSNDGRKSMSQILDATATKDLRTGSAGLMTGVTSPARTWFQLETADDELNQWAPVKRWLETAAERQANLFRSSNLYNVLPEAYMDLFGLGTAAVAFTEDDEDVFRFQAFPIGTYWLAANGRGVIDTCVRDFAYTVRQVVATYGEENCSDEVKASWKSGHTERPVLVTQIILPNHEYDPKLIGGRFKAWRSCHFEAACNDDRFLKESGFEEFPVLTGRWSVTGENVYGEGPGFDVLPDVKELQFLKRRKAQAVDKAINPPWLVSAEMASGELDLRPGATNYYARNATAGAQPVVPLYQPNSFQFGEVRQDINEVQQAIHRGLFADLFLMLTYDQRAQPPTAAEIYERQAEKMLVLGPVLERLNDEFLDPLIGRGFAIMARRGLLPDPPEELKGKALAVRYVSVMAEAQKLAGLGAQERFIGHVGMLAQLNPEVLDKVDWDREVEMYADKVGASAKLVRSTEETAEIRQRRNKAAAAQQVLQGAQMGAKAAKDLAGASLDGNTALTRLAADPTAA